MGEEQGNNQVASSTIVVITTQNEVASGSRRDNENGYSSSRKDASSYKQELQQQQQQQQRGSSFVSHFASIWTAKKEAKNKVEEQEELERQMHHHLVVEEEDEEDMKSSTLRNSSNGKKVLPPPSSSSKLEYLEALRGLAALTVALQHFREQFLPDNLPLTPGTSVTWGNMKFLGHLAVIIFFILSGRILTLAIIKKMSSLERNSEKTVLKMISSATIRRPFRLGVSTFFVLILGFLCRNIYLNGATPILLNIPGQIQGQGLSKGSMARMNYSALPVKTFGDLLLYFLQIFTNTMVVGDRQEIIPVGVLWTIPIEYYNSNLVFLLTALMLGITPNRKGIIAKYTLWILLSIFAWWNETYTFDFLNGLLIANLSVAGIFTSLRKTQAGWNAFLQFLLASLAISLSLCKCFGVNLYTDKVQLFNGILGGNVTRLDFFDPDTTLSIIGLCVLLLLEMNTVFQRAISLPPFRFLGRISFSLYLLHPILLMTLNNAVWQSLYNGSGKYTESILISLFFFYLPFLFLVSTAFTMVIDEPAVRMTKKIVNGIFFEEDPSPPRTDSPQDFPFEEKNQ